jgi:hypothetical protein
MNLPDALSILDRWQRVSGARQLTSEHVAGWIVVRAEPRDVTMPQEAGRETFEAALVALAEQIQRAADAETGGHRL